MEEVTHDLVKDLVKYDTFNGLVTHFFPQKDGTSNRPTVTEIKEAPLEKVIAKGPWTKKLPIMV